MLHSTSEFGRLREALVHRPGRELVRMTPSTREYFLFDDLLDYRHARREHDWFTALLRDQLGVKLHFFDTLLAEALAAAEPTERSALVSQVCILEADLPPVEQRVGQLEVLVRWFQGQGWSQYTQDPEGHPAAAAPGSLPGSLSSLLSAARDGGALPGSVESPNVGYLRARLSSLAARGDFDVLSEDLIEGIESGVSGAASGEGPQPSSDAEALRLFIEGQLFYLTPVPNLMYTRDIATVIGDRLLLARMAAPGRAREPLLLDFVQRFHPRFAGTARWAWAGDEIGGAAWPAASPASLYLEGGNVQQLSEGLIVLGVNQRTSLEAVQRLTDAWRQVAISAGKPIVLYVLRMPAGFNHLDSVFDIIAGNECVAYPPVFEPYGPASVDVVRVELGENPVRPTRSPDVFASLRRDGLDLNVIPVGGDDPVDQQREQWFGGASLLAVAPGKVLIYRSPERTIAELAARGYRIVDMNELLGGTASLSLDDPGKWVLKLKGSELSRGHGGMHSMALPLVRD